MLAEQLKDHAAAAALDAWDPGAICGSSCDLGETLLWIRPEKIRAVCHHLKEQLGFVRLAGVTAIDRHPLDPRFEVVYLLHSISRNQRLKLKVALAGGQPEIDSVYSVWAGADWYEREVFDLFGVRFAGHPDLRRLMMPDNWEGHPLRKDFPVHGHKYSYKND